LSLGWTFLRFVGERSKYSLAMDLLKQAW
jgi:hypothetical protein